MVSSWRPGVGKLWVFDDACVGFMRYPSSKQRSACDCNIGVSIEFIINNLPSEAFEPPLKRTTLKQSSLEQSKLEQSTLEQSTLEQSTLEQSTLEQSTLEQSTLEQSTLEQSTLEQSTLEQSTLEQSTLERLSLMPPYTSLRKCIRHFCISCSFVTIRSLSVISSFLFYFSKQK